MMFVNVTDYSYMHINITFFELIPQKGESPIKLLSLLSKMTIHVTFLLIFSRTYQSLISVFHCVNTTYRFNFFKHQHEKVKIFVICSCPKVYLYCRS